jgi:hypothetical protein
MINYAVVADYHPEYISEDFHNLRPLDKLEPDSKHIFRDRQPVLLFSPGRGMFCSFCWSL